MANEWSRYCSICSVTLSIKTWYRNKFVIWCTDVCKVYIEIKLYVVLKLSFWSSSCARCLDQMKLEVQRYLNDSRNTNTEVVAPTNHNRSKQRDEPINYLQVGKNRRYRMIGFGLPSQWLKNWRDIFKATSKRSNRKCVITFDSGRLYVRKIGYQLRSICPLAWWTELKTVCACVRLTLARFRSFDQ